MQMNAHSSAIGHFLVFEAFFFHDVAPVAGGVADAEKNWFVFSFGFVESFLTPRIPVHGVVSVLEQVGAFLVYQPIRLDFLVWRRQKQNFPNFL